MNLKRLLTALPQHDVDGDDGVEVSGIEFDSRRVGGGELFVCLDGLARNGHDFAATAVSAGARALVVRRRVLEVSGVPQVVVPDTREALARLAAAFFEYPARELKVVGVTGTNGKTTVAHMVRSMVEAAGEPADLFGTVGNVVRGTGRTATLTTPEAPQVQGMLREAADGGTRWVAMEVSSHALAQKRTFATDFSAVVFTNLSRDHLDYHRSLEEYFEAKALLFDAAARGSSRPAVAVINTEDEAGRKLASRTGDRKVTYGLSGGSDYRARHVQVSPAGISYELVSPRGRIKVRSRLVGSFNVLNALAAQAAALELGLSLEDTAKGLALLAHIPGRMETVRGDQPFPVLVDFAHTPDALGLALDAVRGFTSGKVLVVFGCGGDRDPGKRPEMGRVAAAKADLVYVTSDNPRTEDPGGIIDAILAGAADGPGVAVREPDRAAAIRLALEHARPGDAVLIAGKGHETVQVVGTEKLPFRDQDVASRLLKELGYHDHA